jgi:hypothetical protein
MEPAFRFYFNHRRQWIDVYLHDVHPNTFERQDGGRWEYYLENAGRYKRKGLFGAMHFVASRVRVDVFDHCKMHLFGDIMRTKQIAWTVFNEEELCLLSDELTRSFWREYRKYVKVNNG